MLVLLKCDQHFVIDKCFVLYLTAIPTLFLPIIELTLIGYNMHFFSLALIKLPVFTRIPYETIKTHTAVLNHLFFKYQHTP